MDLHKHKNETNYFAMTPVCEIIVCDSSHLAQAPLLCFALDFLCFGKMSHVRDIGAGQSLTASGRVKRRRLLFETGSDTAGGQIEIFDMSEDMFVRRLECLELCMPRRSAILFV